MSMWEQEDRCTMWKVSVTKGFIEEQITVVYWESKVSDLENHDILQEGTSRVNSV